MNDKQKSAIVRDYERRFRENAIGESRFFKEKSSLKEAVELAGTAMVCGRKHNHQRRLRGEVLRDATELLLLQLSELQSCQDFDELLAAVTAATTSVRGVSEMYWYDTALRIGAFLGVMPDKVYLHRGTREGAMALGFAGDRAFITVSELPAPFADLTAREIEDCLCIYKTDLKALAQGVPLTDLRRTKGCAYGQPRGGC